MIEVADFDQDVVDRVCEADRRYFEAYPHKTQRLRRYEPGEGLTEAGKLPPSRVRVMRLGPGLRIRQAVYADD